MRPVAAGGAFRVVARDLPLSNGLVLPRGATIIVTLTLNPYLRPRRSPCACGRWRRAARSAWSRAFCLSPNVLVLPRGATIILNPKP